MFRANLKCRRFNSLSRLVLPSIKIPNAWRCFQSYYTNCPLPTHHNTNSSISHLIST
uniref:Uncharacterized protein n=1 Tax=Anguilla anguilla TaxID=7936 RepID=A0A0E9W1C1_ANGAN